MKSDFSVTLQLFLKHRSCQLVSMWIYTPQICALLGLVMSILLSKFSGLLLMICNVTLGGKSF